MKKELAMKKKLDIIKGIVTNIIDGNSFDMRVTYTNENNMHTYANNERIRIQEIDPVKGHHNSSFNFI